MYIGVKMLKPKLLRLDESTIQEIEELSQNLSKKEYISFSALVRKLIKIGMDNMENIENQSFIDNVRKTTASVSSVKERVLAAFKEDIKRMADNGCKYCVQYPETFRRLIANAIDDNEFGDISKVDFDTFYEMLYYSMNELKKEGFNVSSFFNTSDQNCATGLFFLVEW